MSGAFAAAAQQMQSLPNDSETKVGVLDNGMTYYIRHNDKPAQRAEFYLATNVGALQEAPDQDGLAHFLEHMCFNGTKNFPGKGILNWLESIGASFGGNVNASTGVEQTIYLLNNIPLVRPTVVDTCLLIMHDYSHFVTCDPAEIDAERGVIIEEKRTRNTASWRMYRGAAPYYYGDTKYATTTLIGEQEQLETFKPESLVNFYHTWYVPCNQALIVVGDIDVDATEAKIKEIFADIPAAENPAQKEVIPIPENAEPIVGILTDPENTRISMELLWKSEPMPRELNSTPIGLMTDLLKDIISTVMNERLDELTARPDAPFIGAGLMTGLLCNTCEVVEAQVVAKEGLALESFVAVLTECERMRRYGFTDDEIERAKAEILSQYESKAEKADTRKNSEFVMPMVQNFFHNVSFMDPATEYQMVQMIMPQLQSAVVNQVAQGVITDENFVVVYTGPEKEGVVTPTEEQVRACIQAVRSSEIENLSSEEVPEAFLDPSAIKDGKIKKTAEYAYGATALTLSNGMKVILYPTDIEKNKVSVELFKRGGKTLVSDEQTPSFDENIWSLYTSNTGVGQFSHSTMGKMLSGKQVSVSPYISNFTHGFKAESTTKDLETAFQIMYLGITEPRFDPDEYNQGISQLEAILPNMVGTANYKLQVELYKTVYNSPRRQMISQEVIDKASLQTLEEVYRKIFKGADGATLIIAGDFDPEAVKPLVCKYFGSLAKGKKAERTDWSYRGDGITDGFIVNDFKAKMEAPKVTVLQVYKDNCPYSIETEVTYEALAYIMNMVYTETLREEEGGTYGASCASAVGRTPNECAALQVYFDTNVELADRLRELAQDGIVAIAENGPDAEKFDKTLKNLQKNIPEEKLRVSYWKSALKLHELYGTDDVEVWEAAVNALTPEKIRSAAAALLDSGNFIELVMRPEE